MEEDYKLKMAVISGASHALDYKKENPSLSDEEVLRHVTEQADKIIEKIEDED